MKSFIFMDYIFIMKFLEIAKTVPLRFATRLTLQMKAMTARSYKLILCKNLRMPNTIG